MTEIAKVIKGLERCCVDNCTEGSKCPYYSEKDCLTTLLYDALEQLKDAETQLQYRDEVIYEEEKETARLRKLLKEREPQGWISVKDRLPSNENDVIVAMQMGDEGYWVITAYIGDGGWNSDDSLWEDGYGQFITHWMPMPEPPKEEDGE